MTNAFTFVSTKVKSAWLSHGQAAILFILAAGVFLRLSGLTISPLWYDEAYSLYLTRLPIAEVIRLQSLDVNPPTWEMILLPLVRLFGETELVLRLPAALLSIAALWLSWRLVKEFGLTPVQSAFAAIGLALLPMHFHTAQDGRVYALLSALYLAAGWAAWRGKWLWLGLACSGLLWSHNTGITYALSALAFSLVCHRREWLRIIATGALAGLSFLPWVPNAIGAINNTWMTNTRLTLPFFEVSLLQAMFARSIRGSWQLLAMIASMVSLLSAFLISLEGWVSQLGVWAAPFFGAARAIIANSPSIGRIIKRRAERTSRPPRTIDSQDANLPKLMVFAAGPVILLCVISLLVSNVLFYRPLVPALSPLVIWFAAALTPRRLTLTTWVLPYTWLVLIVVGLIGWSPETKGGGLETITRMIYEQWQEGDIIYHAVATTALPMDYYLPDKPQYILDEVQSPGLLRHEIQDALGFERASLESLEYKRAWVIWSQDPTMSEVAWKRMTEYTTGAPLVGMVNYWQASPALIYLKEK